MKILLDVRAINLLRHGVGRFASEVSSRLPELCPDWEWIFLNYDSNREMTEKEEHDGNITNLWCDSGLHNYVSDQIMYSPLLKRHNPDLIHSFWYHLPEMYRGMKILTVHDRLQEKGFPEHNEDHVLKDRYWMNRSISSADAIIVNSLSTMRDLVHCNGVGPENIFLTYLAAGEEFFKRDIKRLKALRKKYSLPERYIFLSSHSSVSYKNTEFVFHIIRRLRSKGIDVPPLLSTGGNIAERENGWIRLPYLSLSDLAAVITGAEFMIYPSLGEGFGLPLLEAMAAGTPVITSNADSLPEVCGEAAIYFDPNSADDLSGSISLLLNNKNLSDYLRGKGSSRARLFSWDKCALETISAIKEVISRKKERPVFTFPMNWDDMDFAFNLPPVPRMKIKEPESLLYAVAMLSRRNNKPEALKLLCQGLKLFPDSPDILRELGKIYKSEGKWKKASKYFQTLLRIAEKLSAPQHLRSGSYHLAECEFNLKNYRKAETLFRQCLKHCPDHKTAPLFLKKIRKTVKTGRKNP